MDGEEVLNIRVSVAYDKSVCVCVYTWCILQDANLPSCTTRLEDVFWGKERRVLHGEFVRREVYLGSKKGHCPLL